MEEGQWVWLLQSIYISYYIITIFIILFLCCLHHYPRTRHGIIIWMLEKFTSCCGRVLIDDADVGQYYGKFWAVGYFSNRQSILSPKYRSIHVATSTTASSSPHGSTTTSSLHMHGIPPPPLPSPSTSKGSQMWACHLVSPPPMSCPE